VHDYISCTITAFSKVAGRKRTNPRHILITVATAESARVLLL